MLSLFLSAIASVFFIIYSLRTGGPGFPLDDAWIHQTYARNLARYGEWVYVPGHPSAGSTSPLWTLLLTFPYAVGIDWRAWTFSLGIAFSGAAAWAIQKLTVGFGWGKREAFLTSCFLSLEWHMVWAAVSGMEIPLFSFLSLFSMALCLEGWPFQGRSTLRTTGMGILLGLLCLVRPEGLILGALLFLAFLSRNPLKALAFAGGMALCLVAYGAFNFHLSGNFFPNTFYAKAAEYRELVEKFPLWVRIRQVAAPALVGAQVMLIPGMLWGALKGVSLENRTFRLIPILWVILHLLAYALRLPVGYQHGRYVMPVIPVLVALGVPGTLELLKKVPPLMAKVWGLSTGVLLLAFLLLGARAYATDVGIIQCEMVKVAYWLAENTPPGSLIAVHDIGAIGYFSGRELLDLAGLVNPEVIPFIRDESQLKRFILSRGADYFVTFPSWYPTLTKDPTFVPIYSTGCSLTVEAGSDNITVYAVKKEPLQKPLGAFGHNLYYGYKFYDLVPYPAPLPEGLGSRGCPGWLCFYFNDCKLCSHSISGRDCL
ncbi:MAG: hypothetical protein RMK30_07625 [Anaerolineae bacterium]|nr:hypothetical protein [Anaerolineae bacterium]MDW8102728.1 hypothetical protein [Anaerolineae bacterium]